MFKCIYLLLVNGIIQSQFSSFQVRRLEVSGELHTQTRKCGVFSSNGIWRKLVSNSWEDERSIPEKATCFFIDSQMLLVKWTETFKGKSFIISFNCALTLTAVFGGLPTLSVLESQAAVATGEWTWLENMPLLWARSLSEKTKLNSAKLSVGSPVVPVVEKIMYKA